MTDFASIGIEMDSRPVVEGTKALDALGEASARVEQKVASSNGQMSNAAKIAQAMSDQTKAAAQANAVLGGSTSALTIGQQQLIERFREQAATIGMSRSQLMAYQAAQLGVTEQTRDAIAAVKAHEDAMKAANQAKADAAKSTNMLADALKLLAAGYAALKIADVVKDTVMQAARYETLGVVMGVVGKTAGYTKVQMDVASEAIAAQGITMLESRNSAVKLVQAHVDLSNATKLARIAQDAAVIGNINSSEAFDRLVNGISRGNVLILRNIGINVNLQAAYQQMAEELGKSTRELTENERVQARLNAVMERGSDIAGTYEASMGTAGKQILSMQRYVSDLKTTFGETFSEALTIGVMALTDNLKDVNGEVSQLAKNGQLAEWGHDLTRLFVTLANEVSNAFTTFQKFDAWARHLDARKAINADADAQSKAVSDSGNGMAEKGAVDRIKRIEAMRQSALAQENADYVAHQAELSGNFNRFQRAAEEREGVRLAKQKKDADERLRVDQDYAARAQALLIANAGKSIEVQQAAQAKLAKEVYVGTPTYRDTEGRESKPKIDQADSARLQNKLARIQEESAIDKSYVDFSMKLDDMRHKAGELGDEKYFLNRKEGMTTTFLSEQKMYADELAALRAHHNSTDEERERNKKAIDDVLYKQESSRQKYDQDIIVADEGERLRHKAVEEASQDAANKYISGLNSEAEKLERSNGAHEKSRSAIERETVARLDLAIASQQQFIAEQAQGNATEKEIEQGKAILKYLEDMRAARARIATASATQESDLFSKRAADQAIQDWQRAGASIADSLSNAFGAGGKAIGQMFKAYAEGVSGQLKAQKELAAAKRLADDDPAKVDAINRAQLAGTQAQLKSYGDMADAAQGFFDQGSKGYAAMHAASQVLHAAEVALSLVKGVNAVLTQGEGDPYSAFARMAAMAAVVAGLGVALAGGGGGGGVSAADRQKSQGTGSVLGDSNAKSDSIARSIELTASNSSTQINYLAGMEAALRNIETNIGSFASQVLHNTNLSNPQVGNLAHGYGTTNLGAADMTLTGAEVGSYFGPIGTAVGAVVGYIASKIPVFQNIFTSIMGGKQSVADSGFTLDKTSLGALMANGANAKSYADITTSGGWFGSDKTSTQTAALGAETNREFTVVIESLADGVKAAAGLLGECGDDFTKKLQSFVVDIGNVSLKGLTGDEQQKALEAVFSKLGDQMAEFAVAGLSQFQKVGEGYLQTLTRVAADYAKLDASLTSVGMSFGAVGMSSVAARESLISLAGGIDKFQSDTASFAQNFLTKGEQLAPVTKFVADQLTALGLSCITTRDQFKQVVLGLDLTSAAGQKEYAALMSLQSAFAATHAATVDLTKTEQEIADERKTLQDKLDSLTMTSIQLHEKERAAVDASNLALYDRVSALQAAHDGASAALGNVDSAFSVLQRVTKTTTDTLTARITAEKALSDAVKSTLSSMKAQGAEASDRAAAQAQVKAALAIARVGGPLPDAAGMQKSFSVLSQDASSMFATQQDYLKDFYSTKNDIAALGDMADSSLSVDQKQLDSINAMLTNAQQQIDILKGIDTNGLTLVDAMNALTSAIVNAKANPIVGATASINQAYQQYLGRAPDAEGLQWWQNAAASGAPVDQIVDGISHSTEADLNKLYQSVLGRAPDAEGLAFWMKAYGPQMDAAERADWMQAAKKDPGYRVPGFAAGGDFSGGLRLVGEGGPELEVTGPSRIFNASQTSSLMSRLSSSSGSNDALVAEIKALRQEVAQLRENNSAENVAQVKQQQATNGMLERVIYGADAIQTKAAS
jgi:hypothetical protein